MKQPTQTHDDLQRALHTLGSATPPQGMEARIARRLRDRQVELQQHASPSSLGAWLSPWRLALAGALAASGALFFVLARTQPAPPAPVISHLESPAAPRMASSPSPSLRNHPLRLVHHATTSHAPAAAVRSDLLSFPAPRTPLTHQEELLVSLARLPEQQVAAVTAFLVHPDPLSSTEK